MKKPATQAACTIYHNPRCSKSRATLALLEEHGITPTIVEYLKTPLNAAQIKALLNKLNLRADDLIRKGEDIYKSQFAGKNLSDAQLIAAMADNPVLIERPIVVRDDRAVLGRPPENVLRLLE